MLIRCNLKSQIASGTYPLARTKNGEEIFMTIDEKGRITVKIPKEFEDCWRDFIEKSPIYPTIDERFICIINEEVGKNEDK